MTEMKSKLVMKRGAQTKPKKRIFPEKIICIAFNIKCVNRQIWPVTIFNELTHTLVIWSLGAYDLFRAYFH